MRSDGGAGDCWHGSEVEEDYRRLCEVILVSMFVYHLGYVGDRLENRVCSFGRYTHDIGVGELQGGLDLCEGA